MDPSGDSIALIEGWASDRGFLAGGIVTVDLGGTLQGRVRPSRSPHVTSIQWRDEDTIWLSGWIGMRSVRGWASVGAQAAEQLSVDEDVVLHRIGFPLDPRGPLFGSIQGSNGDTTLAVARSASGRWMALDDPETSQLAAGPTLQLRVDEVSWNSDEGLVIEGVIIRPAHRTGPLPLIVNIHGGPAGLWTAVADAATVVMAKAGFAVLRPNPRGSVGWGHEFATANLGDPGGGELRDITAGVAHCIEQGWAVPDAVFATGGSYGGYLTSCLAVFTYGIAGAAVVSGHPDLISARYGSNNSALYDRLLGGAPTRPTIDLGAQRSPVLSVTKSASPTLILHGESDRCTPVGQAEEFFRALTDASVDSELVLYPGEGHGFRNLDNQVDHWCRIIDWFRANLNIKI